MIELRTIDTLAQQEWLDRTSQTVQQAVQGIFKAGGAVAHPVADALHGTWLGHPLHPVLTDIPIGAWTVALVLDALGAISERDFEAGADAAIALGLAGAVGAAASGLTDWKELDTKPLRTGLIHGTLNLGATALYTISLVLRRRGARAAGQGTALLGYLAMTLAAYLGGDLVYRDQIGVSHTNPVWEPLKFAPVLAESDLVEGEPRLVEVAERRIVLVRQDGRIYALAERCSHLGGPLADGIVEDGCIQCPWHGSRFALADGRPVTGPATIPQPSFETRVRNGQIEVRAAD
ncbi:MAG: Rieske 2Fe-2S domain-containing protein [Roseiflexaceae bacterium]